MFKLILTGVLGNDAEVKEVNENIVINFNVAVSLDYKDKEGAKVEKTEWVRATMWRDPNSKIVEYLKKGKRVLIEGVPEAEAYKSKEGELRSVLSVKVRELEFVN
ncbi:single-stranded DNA-binding protein [Xiashengella succiniciproducens]|jgi:single-strand DNA-binding protein|uniref:Single-stranded DNA-binding protein n=1 Tax=Xiashengella succiniciproducens TaxID=2949635 RepID=A0A9J6ZSF9_9BACT|nr:single-stranded DNA-binding protein [Alkaliflexus sp. Ai-910]MDI9538367.1 single-stranded DNA-binding protein [Bacteroidota bacterium]URW80589.1 single-stranded DNA-binding protein [Alkaliflexus sp. Ai-910]HHU00074.1 single-stranded DNA-binding protein [Bacteroidales bacterium]